LTNDYSVFTLDDGAMLLFLLFGYLIILLFQLLITFWYEL
jgi:hypothetical protein